MKALLLTIIAVAATGCTYTRTSLTNPRKASADVVEINGYTYYKGYRTLAPTPDTIRRAMTGDAAPVAGTPITRVAVVSIGGSTYYKTPYALAATPDTLRRSVKGE